MYKIKALQATQTTGKFNILNISDAFKINSIFVIQIFLWIVIQLG